MNQIVAISIGGGTMLLLRFGDLFVRHMAKKWGLDESKTLRRNADEVSDA
jgi:hypothetical protein